jgi:predicted metal-dependent HD superfamily phosphohydrolase
MPPPAAAPPQPNGDLAARFTRAWRAIGGRAPKTAYRRIVQLYTEGRFYHDLGHLHGMFQVADELIPEPLSPTLTIAIFLHDAVYDPRRHDNEHASALLARDLLPHATPAIRKRIAALIEATEHHHASDPETELLIDLDLSFLGAPRPVFMANLEKLVHEFGHLTRDQFIAGQARYLQDLLDRPAIYYTPVFRRRFERRARANLRAAIALSQKATP